MSYYIKIEEKEIKLKDISEFSFKEYNKLIDILNFEWEDISQQYIALLELFTELELEEIKNIKNIFNINFTEILKQDIKVKRIKQKFRNYNLMNFNEITIGKFIDIEYFLNDEKTLNKIEKITALCYLSKDYTEEEFNKLIKEIEEKMNIGNALQVIEIFNNFRNNFYEMYSGLFRKIDDDDPDDPDDIIVSPDDEEEIEEILDEEEEIKNNIGLLEFIYILSDGDYLKTEKLLESNLYSIMNYIVWLDENKKKLDKQQKINKLNGRF